MSSEFERSPEGRALAELALTRLMHHLGPRRHDLVLIGGLVPGILTSDGGPTHVGTTDVDLAVEIGLVSDDLDFGWLEAALASSGFEIDPDDRSGWRWRSWFPG